MLWKTRIKWITAPKTLNLKKVNHPWALRHGADGENGRQAISGSVRNTTSRASSGISIASQLIVFTTLWKLKILRRISPLSAERWEPSEEVIPSKHYENNFFLVNFFLIIII